MNKGSFVIQTDSYQGPLDTLLSLIEKRKFLINDVSLAKITDDYIAYIRDNSGNSIKKNAHFILIASTLLLIKSKSLLPTLELTYEEEQSIEELEMRLKVFKRIKETEIHIQERFGKNISYFSQGSSNAEVVFAPPKEIKSEFLLEAIGLVLRNLPKKEVLPKAIVRKVISLEETIQKLTGRITQCIRMGFKEFSGFGKEDKINIAVSFLAMLELVKEGIIEVSQENPYEEIEMETKVFETPNYS